MSSRPGTSTRRPRSCGALDRDRRTGGRGHAGDRRPVTYHLADGRVVLRDHLGDIGEG